MTATAISSASSHVATSRGDGVVIAATEFAQLDISENLAKHIKDSLGFKSMTRCQKNAIPHLLKGKDVLVKSATGSGKTLSFTVPMIEGILSAARTKRVDRSSGCMGIVIVPTRELGLQVFEVIQSVGRPFNFIVPGLVMGGERKKSEKARLRKGVTILVATPGRLLDHLRHTESLSVKSLQLLVLDEADRLLDMGFEKDLTEILKIISTKKQGLEIEEKLKDRRPPEFITKKKKALMQKNMPSAADRMQAQGAVLKTAGVQVALCSATIDTRVQQLAAMALSDPALIGMKESASQCGAPVEEGEEEAETADMAAEVYRTPKTLKQFYVEVPLKLRLLTLTAILRIRAKKNPKFKALVFMASRDAVDFHYQLLASTLPPDEMCDLKKTDTNASLVGASLFRLHGSMAQSDRTAVYTTFVKADRGILLATDVAARGLDLPNVTCIIQFDPPGDPESYIHRVGRTARMGEVGESILFLQPTEIEYLTLLAKHKVTLSTLDGDLARRALTIDESADPEMALARLHRRFEDVVSTEEATMELACQAYQAYLGAYSAYPVALKPIFDKKALHLGHVAKSLGITKTPQEISAVLRKIRGSNSKSTGKFSDKKRPGVQARDRNVPRRLNSVKSGQETEPTTGSNEGPSLGNLSRKSQRKVSEFF